MIVTFKPTEHRTVGGGRLAAAAPEGPPSWGGSRCGGSEQGGSEQRGRSWLWPSWVGLDTDGWMTLGLSGAPIEVAAEQGEQLQRLLGLVPKHAGRLEAVDVVGRTLVALGLDVADGPVPRPRSWPAGYYRARLEQLHDLGLWCGLQGRAVTWTTR